MRIRKFFNDMIFFLLNSSPLSNKNVLLRGSTLKIAPVVYGKFGVLNFPYF